MTRRSPLVGATALAALLIHAVPASAEAGWVLWEESADMQTFQRAPAPHPRSKHASLEDCLRALDAEWQAALRTTAGPRHHGFNRLTPTSAITMTRDQDTNITYIITYTCLSDSVPPPEPKGK